METQERQYVVEHLGLSEARLLQLTEGLTPEQWQYKEAPGRWSIAENIEHVILVEHAIGAGVRQALASPAEPEKMAAVRPKDAPAKGADNAAGRKIVAMPQLRPTGRWREAPDSGPNAEPELRVELRKVRARSLAFAQETESNLREHFFAHQALGDLDCYQWLIIQSQHGERHAKQIEAVKASPGYPR